MKHTRPTTHDRLVEAVESLRAEVNLIKRQLNSNKYSDTHFGYQTFLEHSSEEISQYKKIPKRY